MSKRIGLGQLFRYLDRLPDFTLLGAGRSVHGGMWRRYELHCPEITCIITEYFERDALLTGADQASLTKNKKTPATRISPI
jgi:hypothetical protein